MPSVCLLPDARGCGTVSPLTSMSQWKGQGCTGGRVRGGATSPRTRNSRGPGTRQDTKLSLNNCARPDVRQTAVAIAAGRLPLCACRARQLTTCDAARSRQTAEAIETGRLATATNFSGVCHRAETERRSKE